MKKMYLYLNESTVTFTQKGKGESVIVNGEGLHDVRLSIGEANALWNGFRGRGFTTEKPVKAPKEPKAKFDRALYEECAETLGVLWRSGNKSWVASANRSKVYEAMRQRGWEG